VVGKELKTLHSKTFTRYEFFKTAPDLYRSFGNICLRTGATGNICLRTGATGSLCERGNEKSGCIKRGEFLD